MIAMLHPFASALLTLLGPLGGPLGPWALAPSSAPARPLAQSRSGSAEPSIELEALDGSVRELPLAGFATSDPRELSAAFVRYRGFASFPSGGAGGAQAVRVELTGRGDTLFGVVRSGAGDDLEIEIAGGSVLSLSISEIASLVFVGRIGNEGDALVAAADEGDRLYRLRGDGLDRVEGLVQSFDSSGIRFESRLGEKSYAWSEVAALFIEDLDAPAKMEGQAGVPVVVDLHGGSRLHGELLELDERGCRLATPSNRSLLLPASTIAEVALDDGSFRFLSDLEPLDLGPVAPTNDALGMVWPPRMDRARTGEVLRAGGREWARGIGVQAPSRIVWALDGEWTALRGRVAIDDSVLSLPRRGSVVFRVWTDGELALETPVVRGGDPPLDLGPIEMDGVRELVLEVDASIDLWIADRANWLRPILVRG